MVPYCEFAILGPCLAKQQCWKGVEVFSEKGNKNIKVNSKINGNKEAWLSTECPSHEARQECRRGGMGGGENGRERRRGVEFGTEITSSSHRVNFLLSLVAWVMETQRKLPHSKCLILNIFGWLLLPDVTESSLYI